MSEDTAVKKRSRSKKVVADVDVAGTDINVSTEAPAKKTRTRKLAVKVAEEVEATAMTLEAPKAKKTRETKKNAEDVLNPKKKASTSSKRVAKKFSNEAQVNSESESMSASKILEQARGFEAERREVNGSVDVSSLAEGAVEHQTEVAMTHEKPDGAAPSSSKTASPIETASAQPIKPSSFLSSFFNDPEPAPVPLRQEQQERIDTPEDSRAELQQATKHDFEDSVLTSRGNVKTSSPPPSAAAAAMMEPPTGALSSAQLRAFTTSSFATLKASSQAPASNPKSPPTAAQTFTSKSTTASSASASKTPPMPSNISATSPSTKTTPKPLPTKAPPPTIDSLRAPKPPSPPTTSDPTSPSNPLKPITTSKPPTIPRPPLFSQKPPQPPKTRPTAMTYAELKANAEYRSLKRRWTAVMVAVPFLVLTSYELWRRWEKGEFGGRDWRREGPKDGAEGVGGKVGGVGRLDEFKSLHRSDTPVQAEKASMVEGGGRVDAGSIGQPIAEVQATIETRSEPTTVEEEKILGLNAVQQAGASKKGWIQVFK